MTRPDVPADLPHQPGLAPRGAAARRWATDAVIAVAVIAIQVGGTLAAAGWHHGHATAGVVTYLLLAAGGASLIARRRYPVAVLALTLAVAIWPGTASQARLIWLALIVAFFTAVQARRRAAAVASLVIGYAASVWPPWLIGSPRPRHRRVRGGAGGLAAVPAGRRRGHPGTGPAYGGARAQPPGGAAPPGRRGTDAHRAGSARRGGAQHLGHQRPGQHRAAPDGPPA